MGSALVNDLFLQALDRQTSMARDRLRSNVQMRAAGVDPSIGLLVIGLFVSGLVLLTMLGTTADSRRSPPRAETPPRNVVRSR
jgi:hypothetical protein